MVTLWCCRERCWHFCQTIHCWFERCFASLPFLLIQFSFAQLVRLFICSHCQSHHINSLAYSESTRYVYLKTCHRLVCHFIIVVVVAVICLRVRVSAHLFMCLVNAFAHFVWCYHYGWSVYLSISTVIICTGTKDIVCYFRLNADIWRIWIPLMCPYMACTATLYVPFGAIVRPDKCRLSTFVCRFNLYMY